MNSGRSTETNQKTSMPRARKGALVQCDPSIRALILRLDADRNDIIYEELDDTHLLVDPSKVEFIKFELNRMLSENIYNPLDEEENA
ncbi:unnamed protein product [Kluyveromyces dobzhanskii CBS 2104]|uniref:General transcription and DNA repair factor IIH subunit TFB5 n=1 Tax=Kluyveromyces dobzhanskii CBS 2104 TaxID=1427455 RepID=A0A0A8LAU9_9SACH|nr:unnamed protein product [Kluyveromyces dobzhanskii CBS 2104]